MDKLENVSLNGSLLSIGDVNKTLDFSVMAVTSSGAKAWLDVNVSVKIIEKVLTE
mgnify:CR=1 FL=1